MTTRDKIFVSYSHKDKKLFDEFNTMLAPAIQRGLVDLWDDRKIPTGSKWRDEIQKALLSARVAVLLVSQNFLASRFIVEKELPTLLKAAEEEGLVIFWMYLSSCLYEQTEIKDYQAAHDKRWPLDQLSKAKRQAVLSEACAKLIQTAQQADLVVPSRVLPSVSGLLVEKITNFAAERERIDEAVSLYEERIPREERYDRELMVDLIRRHLSDEFGATWTMHFLVATFGGRCVGMLICYEDIGRNFAFIAYLATRNPRIPGRNPGDIGKRLANGLMEGRRSMGLNRTPRFLFEVDDPALAESRRERRHRLCRLKVFDRLAPFEAMHFRALDIRYLQPTLEPPWTGSRKPLLLCYAAPGPHETLPKSEAIELLTWVYTELYGDDIFEEPLTRAAYKERVHELLASVVKTLPEQVGLLRYPEIGAR